MKKLLMGVLVIGVIVLLVLPVVGGVKTESTLNTWIDLVNEQGGYELRWQEYRKGLWRTRAVLNVRFAAATDLGLGDDWSLPVRFDIRHGPVLLGHEPMLGWFASRAYLSQAHEAWLAENIVVEDAAEGPFWLSRMHMNLAGQVTIRDTGRAFSIHLDDTVIRLGAYTGKGTLTPRGRLRYSGLLPGVSVVFSNGRLQFGESTWAFESDFGRRQGLYAVPGEVDFRVQTVHMVNDGDDVFELADLALFSSYDLNVDPATGNLLLRLAFASLSVLDERVEDARMELAINRLSTEFLNQYLLLAQQSADDPAQGPLMAMQMMSLVSSSLLPAEPEIRIPEVRMRMTEGDLAFNGRIRFIDDQNVGFFNPLGVLSGISADAELQMSKPLLQRFMIDSAKRDLDAEQFATGELMDADQRDLEAHERAELRTSLMLIQGFLREEGDRYIAKFTMADGTASINGQPLPLPF